MGSWGHNHSRQISDGLSGGRLISCVLVVHDKESPEKQDLGLI